MRLDIGLKFDPQGESFVEMISGLQQLVGRDEYKFYLDADQDCEALFSNSFWGPSNKMRGWFIPLEKCITFESDFIHDCNMKRWEIFEGFVWSYYDGEIYPPIKMHYGWLYSFRKGIFGEVDICQDRKDT